METSIENKPKNPPPFDATDILLAAIGVAGGAAGAAPLFLLPLGQYFLRRSPSVAAAVCKALAIDPRQVARNTYAQGSWPGLVRLVETTPARLSAPARKELAAKTPPSATTSQAVATAQTSAVPPERSKGRGREDDDGLKGAASRPAGLQSPSASMASALNALPKRVLLGEFQPFPASTTAVPLGTDYLGKQVWGDLALDLLHIGIYGTSGAGKDALLRCWFALLASRNGPETLQFAFLDGKSDWLVPALSGLSHMFFPPAGGYGKKGREAILMACKVIDAEAERRQELLVSAGCRTREQYNKRAAQGGVAELPLLVVVVTDVMDAITGEVEALLAALVSKARSLGIRVLVSMQTPTGKGLDWRMNLSTVLAGALVDGSQDGPALGVRDTTALPFRPSKIPPPPQERGVFVAKVRGEFTLLRTPIFRGDPEANEDRFDEIVEGLPRKSIAAPAYPGFAGVQANEAPNREVSEDSLCLLAELLEGSVNNTEGKAEGRPVGNLAVAGSPSSSDDLPRRNNAPSGPFRGEGQFVPTSFKEALLVFRRLSAENRKVLVKTLQVYKTNGNEVATALKKTTGVTGGRAYQRLRYEFEAVKIVVETAQQHKSQE